MSSIRLSNFGISADEVPRLGLTAIGLICALNPLLIVFFQTPLLIVLKKLIQLP